MEKSDSQGYRLVGLLDSLFNLIPVAAMNTGEKKQATGRRGWEVESYIYSQIGGLNPGGVWCVTSKKEARSE